MGCGAGRHSTEHVEVTGQVTYKGQPVTGGEITFVAVEGGFASTGIIDKDGNYKVSAPVGDVKISIDNMMLTKQGLGQGTTHEKAMKGAGKPRPDAPESRIPEGKYVQIPGKYYKTESSGLTYTVKKGAPPFNIELKD
jgi:hypothetical protein